MKNILTPTELFDHRLAALLGYADIDLMKRLMTHRSYLGWQKYWEEEPWGPWRDNLHAATIALQLKRRGNLAQFFYTNPSRRGQEEGQTFMSMLGATATKTTKKEAQRKLKAARQRYKRKRRK